MKAYLDIVKRILEHGHEKKPTRMVDGVAVPVDGGISTIGCSNVLFSHEMSEGFPLLTTRQMPWKSIRIELEGFIKGITSKRWFQERGCKFWDEWCNPQKIPSGLTPSEKKAFQLAEDDLGPVYGFQWRHFDEIYSPDGGGQLQGSDQLLNIVKTLRSNPTDRRMVCSAWNPNQMGEMALPPCHWGWNVSVYDNKLSLFWVQRSCDLMLGVPANIASYALLLELLAYDARLEPGNLSGMLVDCHIYENHIDGAKEQLKREPRKLPQIMFKNNSGQLQKKFDIFDWTYQDVNLLDYDHHPKINMGAVAV